MKPGRSVSEITLVAAILLILAAVSAVTMGILFVGDYIALEYGINTRLIGFLIFCAFFLASCLRKGTTGRQCR